jgi:hypothetical protein
MAAMTAGVGLRTLAEWLAKGRAGDPALAGWVREIEAAERLADRRRLHARRDRELAAAKERWQRFKAGREQWWLEQLGEVEFWRRRVGWLVAEGRTRALGVAVARLAVAVERSRFPH